MGRLMSEKGYSPDLILSSPALRARTTAELVKDAGRLSAEIRLDERIYEASPMALLEIIAGIDGSVNSVMIVGHNPGMETFIRLLSGRIEAMPTAALAVLELGMERWADTCEECGIVRAIYRPKELED